MTEQKAKPALVDLGDRYEVLAHVGSGGMGTVYKAKDNHVDRIVAIKVLPLSAAISHEYSIPEAELVLAEYTTYAQRRNKVAKVAELTAKLNKARESNRSSSLP